MAIKRNDNERMTSLMAKERNQMETESQWNDDISNDNGIMSSPITMNRNYNEKYVNEILTSPMAMKQNDNETLTSPMTMKRNGHEIMTCPMTMK